MKILKRVLRRLYLLRNRLAFAWRIHKRGDTKFLVIPVRFKKYIKRIKYILTVASLFSAYVTFDSLNTAFLLGVVTFFMASILERILFFHDTVFVNPLPNFTLDGNKWIGMGFSNVTVEEGVLAPFVAMIFDDVEYAKKIHDLILEWTSGMYEDERGMVSASVIIDSEESYIFYIYPSLDRDEKSGLYSELKAGFHDKFPDRVHRKIVGGLNLGKQCSIVPRSSFPDFIKMYQEDNIPIILRVGYGKQMGVIEQTPGCGDFVITRFKIRNTNNLTRKDIEYQLIKMHKFSA